MRIALVIERMDTARGGRETSTAQIAEGLARRGMDVSIVCQSGSWSNKGVKIVELGRRGFSRVARLKNFSRAVSVHLSHERYDIVHAMLPIDGCNVYQPRGGTIPAQRDASLRRRRCPLDRALRKLFEPLNLCRREMAAMERRLVADQRVTCLAVSNMVAKEFGQYYGRSGGVRLIYNAVEIPHVEEQTRQQWRQEVRLKLHIPAEATVFVTIATNFKLKGIKQAIVALDRWIGRRGVETADNLVVVGGEWTNDYERFVANRGLSANVRFVLPAEDIFKYYSAADACILLSWYDPCSRVVLEAVRWGLPAITTAYNGAGEILSGGAGLVVSSPRDYSAIIAAYDDLFDPTQRQRRVAACAAVADSLGIDRHVDQLIEAYQETLRKR